jgi:hypothetical protein
VPPDAGYRLHLHGIFCHLHQFHAMTFGVCDPALPVAIGPQRLWTKAIW